uniref:Uncharacterized protein n=1 Tax=Branchiostoma floridae TaxID=7739 RepID=C3YTZ4_BRAFL|eukprot:XP_002600259.1 hypothetical protein BRAFLDRAFT_66766 [Branchiostoma floridae]
MALKVDLPPGNFASKLIKALQMDSKGVFPPPSEKYSDDESSVADTSTIRREIRGWSAATGSTARSSRADVRPISPTRRNNPHPSQMFMSWKVPTRLVTADYNAVNGQKPVENDVLSEVAKVQKKSPVKFVQKKQHERTDTTHFSPPINHKMNLQSEAFERQAESAHYLSKTYPPPKKEKAWESTLPKIEGGTKPQLIIKKKEKKYKPPIQCCGEMDEGAVRGKDGWKSTEEGRWWRLGFCRRQRKQGTEAEKARNSKVLDRTLQPGAKSAVEKWMKGASEGGKLSQYQWEEAEKARNSKVLDRTLQPGAKSAVEKWMKGASEGGKLSQYQWEEAEKARSSKVLDRTLQPGAKSAVEKWMKGASEGGKSQEYQWEEAEKARNSKVLDRTLQPGAKSAVEKWMKGASEGEKLVAMEFFKSLAGQRLMGGPAGMATDPSDRHAKRSRLEAVLKTLESSKGKTGVAIKLGAGGLSKSAPAGTTRLGPYVVGRLLSPQTRHNKMEYQTWHHMPVYPANSRVENRGAMYIAPHGFVPRHFTIHPEWS